MATSRPARRAALAAVLVLLAAPLALAAGAGKLYGKVLDDQGRPVGNIVLTFTPVDQSGNAPRTLKVDRDGRFGHAFFPTGRYKVGLEGEGFIKSMSMVVSVGGSETNRERGDAHPEQGLPPFSIRLGERVDLELVVISQAAHRQMSQQFALAEAKGPLKRVSALYNDGEFAAALTEVDEIIAKSPQIGQAHYLRGCVLARLERHDEALAAFERALALTPEQPDLHDAIGSVLLQKAQRLAAAGRPDQAAPVFGQSADEFAKQLETKPGDAGLLAKRAAALEGAGRIPELRDALRQLVASEPANSDAVMRLASLELDAGASDEAIRLLLGGPKDKRGGQLIYNVAARLFNDGKLDEALELAGRAIEFDPGLAPAHRLVGLVRLSKGEHEAAIAPLKRAIELAPDDPAAAADREIVKKLESRKK